MKLKGVCLPDDAGSLGVTVSLDVWRTHCGKLLGLESGDNNSHESYLLNHRRVFHGKLLAYIQSMEKPGEVEIIISALGLGKQTINLFTGK